MSSSNSAPARVSVEERLFSLVLALLATETGLTKTEVLSTVQGYRQRFTPGADSSSLERQFERDKDDLRELGIPLETIDSPDRPGDNQSSRYRIPKGLYDLPADIAFSSEELGLLALAATVWREGSLSGDSRRAITKLRSLGVESNEPVIGYAPRLRVREAAFEPLGIALDRRQLVRFDYLKPGEPSARTRTVAPLAVVLHEGRWHLFALDQDAQATRTFLLSRMIGTVSPIPGSSFTPPEPGQAERALAELDELWRRNVAELTVEAGTDAELRLSKRHDPQGDEKGIVRLHFTDLNVLADELAGYGPEVRVIRPQELIDAVRVRLQAVVAAHRVDGDRNP